VSESRLQLFSVKCTNNFLSSGCCCIFKSMQDNPEEVLPVAWIVHPLGPGSTAKSGYQSRQI